MYKKINHLTLLLASAALLFVMFFNGLYTKYIPFLVLLIIGFSLSFVSLFLIHHPNLQLRLTVYNSIILLAFQLWIGYVLIFVISGPFKMPLTSIFPLIAFILNFLAINLLRKSITASQLSNLLNNARTSRKFGKRKR